jgi:nucleoside-diphosphate-sugar epimerase
MTPLPVTPGTHLVVGAGEAGTSVALLLADAGVDVLLLSRRGRGPVDPRIRLAAADAASLDALLDACPEAVVVYNCVNPEYTRWPTDWPPIAAALLAYAEQTGAVLATVSNLYGYGPVDVPMTEDLPYDATTDKSAVRVRMWGDAKAAHDSGRIRYTEVRGSDYLCPGRGSMFGDRVMPRILEGRAVQLIGDVNQPHTWTAPVDMARTLVTVANDPRGWGRAWHVPSNAPRTQRQVVQDLAVAAGVPAPKVSSVPKPVLWGLGLVQPVIRELRETDYQRERPYVMDDSAAREVFGLEPTPWADLVAGMVAAYRSGSLAA